LRVTPKRSVASSARLPATVVTAREMPSPLSDAGPTLRPTLRAAVLPSLPWVTRRQPVPRRAHALRPAARTRALDAAARSRTLFSMPLAYPSTLDRRRPGSTSSYVEELWSPSLVLRLGIRRRKHTLIRSANSRLARRGSFSLRRGLDSVLRLLQAGHHPLVRTAIRLRNDEGDPAGSPSREAAGRSTT
jgi:hypothetical protein